MEKKYVIISGLALRDSNRGTAALGYGAFSFMVENGYLNYNDCVLTINSKGNPFRQLKPVDSCEVITINGNTWHLEHIYFNFVEWKLLCCFGLLIPFTKLWRYVKQVKLVAAINGGDGFSDIYGKSWFRYRLWDTKIAMYKRIPVILLPQTIGPFEYKDNLAVARKIMKYADIVYVRDNKFVPQLEKMGVKYELTNDLSYFMKPEPWNIQIDSSNAIGINVSGLAYSNTFYSLSGQFDNYPVLIDKLIKYFQSIGKTVYLIPHSYIMGNPDPSNDDIEACAMAYDRLENKDNIIFIDKDLISPQVKYVISRMSFFIGTRMHANFAAIFSKVPLYGLAYSFKFQGAFENNGIYGRTSMINNISLEEVENIVKKVAKAYAEDVSSQHMQ